MSAATTERPQTVENIKVLQIGKFGVRVDEKTWFNVNEPLTPTSFVVGNGYKVSVSTSKAGKKYINQIIGVEDTGAAQAAAAPAQAAAPAATAPATPAPAPSIQGGTKMTDPRPSRSGFGQPLTDYDLAKDSQIARSGIIQAALQSPGIVQWSANIEEYMSNVRRVSEFALKFVKEQ